MLVRAACSILVVAWLTGCSTLTCLRTLSTTSRTLELESTGVPMRLEESGDLVAGHEAVLWIGERRLPAVAVTAEDLIPPPPLPPGSGVVAAYSFGADGAETHDAEPAAEAAPRPRALAVLALREGGHAVLILGADDGRWTPRRALLEVDDGPALPLRLLAGGLLPAALAWDVVTSPLQALGVALFLATWDPLGDFKVPDLSGMPNLSGLRIDLHGLGN